MARSAPPTTSCRRPRASRSRRSGPMPTPDLVVRLKKHADGTSSLACTRADGSTTWQKNGDRTSTFFPLHDLTHFAVESTLRCKRGFYGLLAEGWNITDFGHPWPRGRIPADAEPAEVIVGCLDRERA